jgi:L-erythrulose 1-phosphate isomerase
VLWAGTSWKMNGLIPFARDYASRLASQPTDRWNGVQPFVIPSSTALAAVHDALGDLSGVMLGAQNAHWEDSGAWTGEVSVPQVADAGAQIVELGHSERRENFGETDRTVNLKVKAVMRHGLRPLICIGEPESTLQAGTSSDYISHQVEAALDGIPDTTGVLLAYEPIWAIGDSGREPRPDDIADGLNVLATQFGASVEGILYGGSVNAGNAAGILALPGVGGLFVGRSAWNVDGYMEILDIAARCAAGPRR